MPSVLVFYHYFHPDDVVSAQHYADLCAGLRTRGWEVTVMPCNRGCRDESRTYPRRESWEGVEIRRVWRPRFRQASTLGRLLNATWMISAWSLAALRWRPDAVIIGTDPIFAVFAVLPWRWLRPRTRIFHWCFDLHPEAAIAENMVAGGNPLVRLLRAALSQAYRACDLIGSLGPCMTRLLEEYQPGCPLPVITPWALSEPAEPLEVDPEERQALFGKAKLALMYSGNFGKAHDFQLILNLARRLRDYPEIRFAISIRGNRAQAFRDAVGPEDTNIAFVDFAPQDRLERRLGAADIHLVSLQPEYTGTVVPSKFQGAIATGRPILFAGDPDSALGCWIREHGLGWTLVADNAEEIGQALVQLLGEPDSLSDLRSRCHRIYQRDFSREAVIGRVNTLLTLPAR